MADHGVTPAGDKSVPLVDKDKRIRPNGNLDSNGRGVKKPSGWAAWRAKKAAGGHKPPSSSRPARAVPAKPVGKVAGPHGLGNSPRGGVPMGEQLDIERDEVEAMHKFSPAGHAKLRRATAKALGRG